MKQCSLSTEPLTDTFIGEITPLLERSISEMNIWGPGELDVDWMTYFACQDAGIFRLFTCRDAKTAVLVGYATYHIQNHPHCKGVKAAFQDALYLAGEYRLGATGIRLLKYSERELQKEGVQLISQRTQPERDIGIIFERLGYTMTETVFTKRL